MIRPSRALTIALYRFMVLLPMAMPVPLVAMEFSWYQQRAAGDVSGELRLKNLAMEDLRIFTPGRFLEYGIVRLGDRALVTLDEPIGSGRGQIGKTDELLVVATQGARSVQARFRLTAAPSHIQAAPDSSRSSEPDSHQAVQPDPGPVSTPDPAISTSRSQIPGILPAAAAPAPAPNGNIQGESTGLPDTAGIGPVSSARHAVCRVLLLRQGTLRENVGRLVRECGARLGRWHTSSSPEWLVDWKVPAPELLTRRNTHGLAGLLDLLEKRFQLAGVPDVDRPGVIDFYRLRIDPYRADPGESG